MLFDFEELTAADGAATAGLVGDVYRSLVRSETALLELAVHWADLHSWVEDLNPEPVSSERARQVGGLGTPYVLEYAAGELGAMLETTTTAAVAMMGDALDLRHRLPLLWGRVRAGEVRSWKARKVAVATRHLTLAAAGRVDQLVAGLVVSLPWGRFERVLDAAIVTADPADAEQQRRIWEADRFVRTGRTRQYGIKTLIARASAGDVIWFKAMVDRIAEILLLDGDTDSADVRRSKAIGILAKPAVALRMLIAHGHDADSPDLTEPGTAAAAAGQEPEHEPSDLQSVAGLHDPDEHKPTSEAGAGDAGDRDAGDRDAGDRDAGDRDAGDRDAGDGSGAGSGAGAGAGDVSGRGGGHRPGSGLADRAVRGLTLPTIDPAKLRPPAVLYIHLSEDAFSRDAAGVARFEGVGPVTIDQARRFLSHCNVRIQPVLDVADIPAADAYETPHRLREALHLRNPADVFPWGTNTSRHVDADHTIPYVSPDKGGAGGQTGMNNLGPLSRHHHRTKTHSRWRMRQPSPGVYLWRSPHGYTYLVTASGTQPLGKTTFAYTIWRAANPKTRRVVTTAA